MKTSEYSPFQAWEDIIETMKPCCAVLLACTSGLAVVWFNDRSGSPECPSVSRPPPWHRDERWNGDCDWCNYAAADWRRGQIITGLIGLCLDWEYATLWLKCCRKVCVYVCVCVCVGQSTGFKQQKEKKYFLSCLTFQQDTSSVCRSFFMALIITLTFLI